jgi:hypothetical protein
MQTARNDMLYTFHELSKEQGEWFTKGSLAAL